jgi:hypothetical protein
MPPPSRLLPYADALVTGIVRAALPGVEVGTLVPADLYPAPRPFVLAHRVGGAAIDPRFLDSATVDVQAFAPTRRGAADLAEVVRVALFDAWRVQLVTPDGHLASFREIAGPAELRTANQPDSLYRFQATYAVSIRPPRPPVLP